MLYFYHFSQLCIEERDERVVEDRIIFSSNVNVFPRNRENERNVHLISKLFYFSIFHCLQKSQQKLKISKRLCIDVYFIFLYTWDDIKLIPDHLIPRSISISTTPPRLKIYYTKRQLLRLSSQFD